MRTLLEPLEARTLLSAITPATLAANLSAISAHSTTVISASKNLTSHASAALAKLTADVAALPAPKRALFTTVKTDLSNLISSTTADTTSLTKPITTLATKAEGTGITQLSSFTPAAAAALNTDSTALPGLVVAPLGNLNLDLSGPLVHDLGILTSANPTATKLAADIAALNRAYAADAAALTAGSNTFNRDVSTFSSTLATESTMLPNILFTYKGTFTNTVIHKTFSASLVVSVENANGVWTGMTSVVNAGGVTVHYPAVGTISSNGDFTATFAVGGSSEHLTGTLIGKTIAGSAIGSELGTFTVTH